MSFKRLSCLLLAIMFALLSLSGLTGCTKKVAEKTVVDHVFRQTDLTLPEGIQYINSMQYMNGRIYITGSVVTEDIYREVAYSIKEDGTDITEIKLPENTNDNKVDGDKTYYTYAGNPTIAADGNLWYQLNEGYYDNVSYEGENKFSLVKQTIDGTELGKIDLSAVIDALGKDNMYLNSFTVRKDGSILINLGNGLALVKEDGTLIGSYISSNDMYINNSYDIDGTIYIIVNNYTAEKSTTKLNAVDFATGTLGAEITLPGNSSNYAWSMIQGEAYDFYYNSGTALYGFNVGDTETTEIINWINSDVSSDNMNQIISVNDKRFLISSHNYYSSGTGRSNVLLTYLDYVAPEDVVPKYNITLACFWLDYNVKAKLVDFNRKSEEYRISVKDYSEYNTDEDYSRGLTILNNDIIAGNIPDILMINSEMDYASFASKGMFADLYTYMDNDPEIKRADYLENVLKALETDGKLYTITPSFNIYTMTAKTKFVGTGGMTFDKLNEIIKANPGMAPFQDMSQEQLLESAVTYTYDTYVNSATGKCNFDSDGFKQMLEFAKTMSTESFWESMGNGDKWDEDAYQEFQSALREDRALLSSHYSYGFDSYKYEIYNTFGTDEVSFVGFPTYDGNGSAILPNMQFAISSRSDFGDGAWNFIRLFLLDDYQENSSYAWPLKLSALEKKKADALDPEKNNDGEIMTWAVNSASGLSSVAPLDDTIKEVAETEAAETEAAETEAAETDAVETDEEDKKLVDDTPAPAIEAILPGGGYQQQEQYQLTEAKCDEIIAFVKSVNKVVRGNQNVVDVIKETASAYFADQKSLDETVKIIQNRAQLVINESR